MKIESRFEDSARRLIRDLLQSNPTDFWDVVRQSLGLFPTEVYRIMEEIDPQKLKTLVSKSRREMPDYKRRINVENNPILSSWYFTDATCRKIRNLRNWKNSRVAFLGAPKLFDWFASRRIGKSRLLIDLDEKVIDAFIWTIFSAVEYLRGGWGLITEPASESQ